MLKPGKVLPALLIPEIQLNNPARDQPTADQDHGDEKVVADQTTPLLPNPLILDFGLA